MTTGAQRALIETIRAVLSGDSDVDAAWLAGSLGAGGGDAFSDVDILALAPAGRAGEVAARYAADLSAIAPVVLVNVLYSRVVSAVADDWRRFDLSFVEPAELDRYDRNRLTPLFNRIGHEPPAGNTPPHRVEPEALGRTIAEFWRVLGLSVVGLGRGEHVVSLSGQELLRRMIVDLMLDENGVGVAERGGALRRNPLLTPEQRAELAALPPVRADREGILAGNAALAAVFLPRARRLAARVGAPWPDALEAATRAHLLRHLDQALRE
ncbi:hypothetical protein [Phenylobacterium sp.]|uniref:hypothetical protein n=1 Tax=Phenylobacterium sp. TaxID=1871053 RepID=UPI0025FFAF17|nr:hypothetical protein [Phenylobacterium sp.]MBX3485066.1 hypothetical protein [Phenylobacterium sp.]MCW5758891.1 hypothetical protein [Phenylobacterium sp.]